MPSTRGETKSFASVFPFVDYNEEYSCFQLKNGEYLDIQKIVSGDIFNISEDEINYMIYSYSKFYKTYGSDIKIVSVNLPTDTRVQQEYTKHKMQTTDNEVFKQELQVKLDELEYIEKNSMDRLFYLFYFADTPEKIQEYRTDIQQTLGKVGLAELIDKKEKEKIFFKFNNRNSLIFEQEEKEYLIESSGDSMENIIKKKGFNPFLAERIQPKGGISWNDERYMKTGDGYMCCLSIYRYPKKADRYWLYHVFNIENAIVTVDVKTETLEEVTKNINRSMKENRVRIRTEKDDSAVMDAEQKYFAFQELYEEISNMSEVIKTIFTRVFLSAKTQEELDVVVAKAISDLKGRGYSASVFLNESKNDWLSFYRSYKKQSETVYKRIGQAVTASGLSVGLPFDYTGLNDSNSFYYGWTNSGKVLLDLFSITNTRLSYSLAVAGDQGAGKSTFLKKIMMSEAIKGTIIRGLDPSNEWTTLINYLGGKIISLDGSQGMINPFEIFKTAETEELSYLIHISKLDTMYKFLVPDCGQLEIIEFTKLVRQLYKKWGLSISRNTEKKITGMHSQEYPTFSDFLMLVREEQEKIISTDMTPTELEAIKEKLNVLSKIEAVSENIVENYGYILDGHTSIENVLHTQIVFFNIKNLSHLKSEIFDAQVFSALALCWNNCMINGEKMKNAWENKSIAWEDITRFVLFIDEAHHLINTSKLHAVQQMSVYIREARKYFGSLLFATQNIRDYMPEESDKKGVDLIKSLFQLTQYKFIMRQDSGSVEAIQQIFKNQLTETELAKIPMLGKGETILSIKGDKNIAFTLDVSDDELALYRGGA